MFDLNEFAWAIINFLVFFLALRFLFFKPVMAMLDSRKKEVADTLARAENAEKEAERLRKSYQEQMDAAHKESQEIMNKATRVAEEKRSEIVAQAQNEAARLIEKAQESIEREKQKALQELRQEVAALAVMAAGKVIGKTLTPEDHARLVDEFVSEAGDLKC